MKMHQHFRSSEIRTTALQKQYSNVSFINFSQLLESLKFNRLISEDFKKEVTNTGIIWDNYLSKDGIILETDANPYVKDGYVITVTGSKHSIDTFEYLLNVNNVIYEGHDSRQIYIKLEYHDQLNPTLWKSLGDDEYELFPDVLDALHNMTDKFVEFLDMPSLKIEDVTLTGSSCNYNWTKHSDIDLHIVVDFKKTEAVYGKLVESYFNAQRKVWNELHDLTIKGIPVELYVQDSKEEHYSTGIYSILDEEWVEQPTKQKPTLDFYEVRTKASRLMKEIDLLLKSCTKSKPVEDMMTKLTDMRKSGLEEGGEYSVDNYTFKVLRNEGYIDKLMECKNRTIDRELSVEEEELFNGGDKDDPWEDLGYTKRSNSTSSTSKVRNHAPNPSSKKQVWLNVPYSQRESAKRFGCRYDPGIKKWYYVVQTADDLKRIPSSWR